MGKWYCTVKRDFGGYGPETVSGYNSEGYRMVQRAAFQACEDPGDYVRVTITAKNMKGLTLIMEDMGWTQEGLRHFEDVCFEATELTQREESR